MKTMTFAACLLALGVTSAGAQTPSLADLAESAPDQLAWMLFIEANTQAATPGNNNALFETWASDGDTFNLSPQWPGGPTPKNLAPPAVPSAGATIAQEHGVPMPQVLPFGPTSPANAGEETRRNKADFDFIVQNNLFKVSGLQAAYGQTMSFPVDSIEVKANWYRVRDPGNPTKSGIPGYTGDPAQAGTIYHVNTASDGQQYALVSMHVISKIVPNWTWATFEHQNNPGRCDVMGCKDNFGATDAFVSPLPTPGQEYQACTKTPALQALIAAANWDPAYANYCLKGSQVDFTTATGLAVRLGNSVTEMGFVNQASCMTCHARAAFDSKGAATTFAGFDPVSGQAPIGTVDPSWFWTTASGDPPYFPMFEDMPNLQQIAQAADFVWSIPFCAINDTATPPQTKSRFCSKK